METSTPLSQQLVEKLDKKIRKDMEGLKVFHMCKELVYILEIIFGLLETLVNLITVA